MKDKDTFYKYLRLARCGLSANYFVNVFIWKDFFDFKWEIIDGNLCVFAENKIGCFLCLPPSGRNISKTAVRRCFEIMDAKNLDKNISRIENIEERDQELYKKIGFSTILKSQDYLYRRKALADLKGNPYKSKRAAVNYFIKNYQFEYFPFRKKYSADCLNLYRRWAAGRKKADSDRIYLQMIDDNLSAFKTAMSNFSKLDLVGSIVRIKNKIRGFTCGFKLNQDTFCILFEVADLRVKGLANFMFREFCRELKSFKYINCMDDSGLENLKRAKLSFRPYKLIPAYIAVRN
ncbi:MAG: phosphatidylglycerol lysyltransferase domain-containing protein [Candidatus Omnitrophota bacterium]|nr:phosphatidylglycerol lysyltransferase domain-containing protein [Candidatus Omnitrophota bacterium]